jgi:glycosyltransferase involved in cell wall biosynthesis
MPMDKISVIIPAHNEEKYIGKCLDSIRAAESQIGMPVEIVVSLNRCTDKTEAIAKSFGAVTVVEDIKNIARIRNTAIENSSGDILVTIDSDSWMTSNMLQEVLRLLRTGKYIGGGVSIKPERISIGILFSLLMVLPYMLKARISAGMFWLLKKDLEAIGGFDEDHISVEDYFFGIKLRSFGLHNGLKYGTIRKAHIVTSCRKFDEFGDWYLFRNPKLVRQIFTGIDRKAADKFYYDVKR